MDETVGLSANGVASIHTFKHSSQKQSHRHKPIRSRRVAKRSVDQVNVALEPTPLLYQPTSAESQLLNEFAGAFARLQGPETWIRFVPARIGSNRALDLATRAVVQSQLYLTQKDATAKVSSIRSYLGAIDAFQTMMKTQPNHASDIMILTISLMSVYESVMGTAIQSTISHNMGLYSLFKYIENTQSVNEVTMCMFYDHWTITFLPPCAMGTASPFDSPFWNALPPPTDQGSSNAIRKLRQLSNQLFLRLPGLISRVRTFKRDESKEDVTNLLHLASELLKLEDREAENDLLHLINVSPTSHPSDATFIPYHFNFKLFADYRAASYYWTTRILTMRICSKLHPTSPSTTAFDPAVLGAEIARMRTNILMSSEYGLSIGAYGTTGGGVGLVTFALAINAAYGALSEVETFRGRPAAKAQKWLTQRMQILFGPGMAFSVGDMDEMSELFVGGPLGNILPRLVSGAR